MSDTVFGLLMIGALPLAVLILMFFAWLDQWVEGRKWRKWCLVCKKGDGVLLNDRSDQPTYLSAKGWCPEHRERIDRIRKMEHELLDLPGPDQYVNGDPLQNLVKKITAWDGTVVSFDVPKEPGAASPKDGGIR